MGESKDFSHSMKKQKQIMVENTFQWLSTPTDGIGKCVNYLNWSFQWKYICEQFPRNCRISLGFLCLEIYQLESWRQILFRIKYMNIFCFIRKTFCTENPRWFGSSEKNIEILFGRSSNDSHRGERKWTSLRMWHTSIHFLRFPLRANQFRRETQNIDSFSQVLYKEGYFASV